MKPSLSLILCCFLLASFIVFPCGVVSRTVIGLAPSYENPYGHVPGSESPTAPSQVVRKKPSAGKPGNNTAKYGNDSCCP
ncbi:hypothetical protein V6N13_105386 [Hibiscus sabdariffa]|uniref:Secreted protein n=1 Tax=Hibiscus sabdariffa TaxID=183260 RepID=A0ABR2EXS1_9ROSI